MFLSLTGRSIRDERSNSGRAAPPLRQHSRDESAGATDVGYFARGIWVIAYRELLRFVRERSRIASSLADADHLHDRLQRGAQAPDRQPGRRASISSSSCTRGSSPCRSSSTRSSRGSRSSGIARSAFSRRCSSRRSTRAGVVLGKALGAAIIALFQSLVMLALAPAVRRFALARDRPQADPDRASSSRSRWPGSGS